MFKTILAYVIVIALGQFAFTIGTLVGSGLFGMLLYYLPLRIKAPIAATLAGIFATVTVMSFGYGLFTLFTGRFGFYSFLAAVLSMLIPLYNDYNKYIERRQSMKEIDWQVESLAAEARAMVAYEAGTIAGAVMGIAITGWYFFF